MDLLGGEADEVRAVRGELIRGTAERTADQQASRQRQ
jgi:hypothetical protein